MKKIKGSNLIEVIFAVFILSMISVFIFNAILTFYKISNLQNQHYLMSLEASNAIESYLSNKDYKSSKYIINTDKKYYEDYYILTIDVESKENNLNVQFQRYIEN